MILGHELGSCRYCAGISHQSQVDSMTEADNQLQDITAGLGMCWYHAVLEEQAPAQFSSRLETRTQQDLTASDALRVGPIDILAPLALPPDFPPYVDSIRAEIFSQQMTPHQKKSTMNTTEMLELFQRQVMEAYGGNLKKAPTMFSYSRVANFHHHIIPIQFGVSAPRRASSNSKGRVRKANQVRAYRVRQCWGESSQKPPPEREGWKHGQCAENQSLPSIVGMCEALGLKDVVIETLSLSHSGKFVGMCRNCQSYVIGAVLHKHPTWKVRDVHTGKIFCSK